MPIIRRTSQAYLDLVEIWTYVAQDSIKAADGLLDRIDQESKLIAGSPKIGRKREESARGLRSFPVNSYVIFYRIQPSGIEIIRVLHGARDIDNILTSSQRLSELGSTEKIVSRVPRRRK